MLTEKGQKEAKIMGTIIVMLDNGWDEKDIAESLSISRVDVIQRILQISNTINEYSRSGEEYN